MCNVYCGELEDKRTCPLYIALMGLLKYTVKVSNDEISGWEQNMKTESTNTPYAKMAAFRLFL